MGNNLNSKIIKIGLCGGSGSGKGEVGSVFKSCGISVIDTDGVYHKLTSGYGACMRALEDEFGSPIVNADGSLNRIKLGDIVFADGNDHKLKRLNEITHKHITMKTDELIESCEKSNEKIVVIDAPLLFESGFNKMCDIIICVISDIDHRIGRIINRDKITREKAETRISKQLSDEFLIKHSDYIIRNNSEIISLREQTMEIIAEIQKTNQ